MVLTMLKQSVLLLLVIKTVMGSHHEQGSGQGPMADTNHIFDSLVGHLHHSEANEVCMHEREEQFAEQVDLVAASLQADHIVGGSIVGSEDGITVIKTIWRRASDSLPPYVKYISIDSDYEVTAESDEEPMRMELEGEEVLVRMNPELAQLHIFIHNRTVNCSYIVDLSAFHSDILTHPIYDSFALSPDKRRLLYMAEGLAKEFNETWRKNAFTVAGAVNPKIVVVDLYNQEVRTLSLPAELMPGKSVWTPDNSGIVSVIRPRMYTPCAECTDGPSRLAYIDLDDPKPQLWYLTDEDKRASVPHFIEGKMLFFSNYLLNRDTPAMENEAQNLESIDFPFQSDPSSEVIVSSYYRKDNFYGLFPDRLSPWTPGHHLEDGQVIVINSLTWLGYRPVLVNFNSGELQILNRLMQVLDVKDEHVLGLTTSVNGFELLIGQILDLPPTTTADPSMIKWNNTVADPCQDLLDSLFHGSSTMRPSSSSTGGPSSSSTARPSSSSTAKPTTSTGATMTTTGQTEATTTEYEDHSVVEREGDFHTIINGTDNGDIDVDEMDHGVLYSPKNSENNRLLVLFTAYSNLDFYLKTRLTRFFLHLNWDVLKVEHVGQFQGQILTIPVENAHTFIQSVAENYTSKLLFGRELDGTLAILLAALHPQEYKQVVVGDGIMLLSTTMLYQPRLYSRLIGKPFPEKPSPSQVVTLWRHSPLSATKNFSATTLVFSRELWPKQSERFVERVDKEGNAILEFWNETSGISFEQSSMDIAQYTAKFFQIMGGYESEWCGDSTMTTDATTATHNSGTKTSSASSQTQTNQQHSGGQVSSTHAVTIDAGHQEAGGDHHEDGPKPYSSSPSASTTEGSADPMMSTTATEAQKPSTTAKSTGPKSGADSTKHLPSVISLLVLTLFMAGLTGSAAL